MGKFKIDEIIPIGLILPLLVILIVEILLSYGLNLYNSRQLSIIEEKRDYLNRKENEIINKIKNNEGYLVFSQYVNVAELAKSRRYINFIIDRFNLLMPKFLIIESFSYDEKTNNIDLQLRTKDWNEYLKLITYLKNNEYFSIENADYPKFDKEKESISFRLTLRLKNKFFQSQ